MSKRPNEVWVDDPEPGGWICGVCLYPVESEPCEQHDGAALTDEQLERLAAERMESLARAVATVTPCSCSAQRARAGDAEAKVRILAEDFVVQFERANAAEAERDEALAEVANCGREAWKGRAARAEARLAAVEALAAEFANSGCIHLNTMWGRLRAALDGEASA